MLWRWASSRRSSATCRASSSAPGHRGVRGGAAARRGLCDVGALAEPAERSTSSCRCRSPSSPAWGRRLATTAVTHPAFARRRGSPRRYSPRARWRCRAGRSTGWLSATSSTTQTLTTTATRTAPSTALGTPTSAGFPVSPAKASATAAGDGRRRRDGGPRTAVVWLALGLVVPGADRRLAGSVGGHRAHRASDNHTMFAVNSTVHAFGSQPFRTGDESRNNRLIAALAFGEGWHNNHHAFPAAAYHGMERSRRHGHGDPRARAHRPRLGRAPPQPGCARPPPGARNTTNSSGDHPFR